MRSIHEHDDGQWLKDALTDCPPYVTETLPRLLPDLLSGPVADGSGSMLHLFSAVTAVLTRLSELQPLAVLIEDLHWADSATLDLVEQLASRPAGTTPGRHLASRRHRHPRGEAGLVRPGHSCPRHPVGSSSSR